MSKRKARPRTDGVCCDCGYAGSTETPCAKRADETHCVHWWEAPATERLYAPGEGRMLPRKKKRRAR